VADRYITFIQEIINRHFVRGRSLISRVLCEEWQWKLPNGNPKGYAVGDILLRLEETGYTYLPERIYAKNNIKKAMF